MKVIFGADERTPLTEFIHTWLRANGHEVALAGHMADEAQKWHWAKIGHVVGEGVASGQYEMGVAACWSGTGVSIAANRHSKARAALCWDAETARLARKWDDANVLCVSLRYTTSAVAEEILSCWFSAKFDEEGLGQVALLDN